MSEFDWDEHGHLVTPSDAEAFFENGQVDASIRSGLLLELDRVIVEPVGPKNADSAIRFVLSNNGQLDPDMTVLIAENTTLPTAVIEFLLRPTSDALWGRVDEIITALGTPYSSIFDMGAKSPKFHEDQLHTQFLQALKEREHIRGYGRSLGGTLNVSRRST